MSSDDEIMKKIERLSLSTEALSVVVAWQTAREEVKDLQLQNMKKNKEEIELQLKKTEAKSAELVNQLGRDIDMMQRKQEEVMRVQQEASRSREETVRLEMERRENEREKEFSDKIAKEREEHLRRQERLMMETKKLVKEVENSSGALRTALEEKELLEIKVGELEAKVSVLVATVMQRQNQNCSGDVDIIQEVDSLAVILEMKNKELKTAREESLVMKKKLADHDHLQESAKSLKAQVEDLKVQVAMKRSSERSMEVEMIRLQNILKKETKEKRCSLMEKEQLEWRIFESGLSCDSQEKRFRRRRLVREGEEEQYEDMCSPSLCRNVSQSGISPVHPPDTRVRRSSTDLRILDFGSCTSSCSMEEGREGSHHSIEHGRDTSGDGTVK